MPLLGSVLYGLYRTTAWLVATEIAARTGSQAGGLLAVNTLLWPLSAGVAGLLLVHLGQSWQWILRMNNARILFGYVTAVVMHGLAFGVLAVTRNHLLHTPGADTSPGFATAAAAVGCANLLVFTLVRNLLGYKSMLGKVQGAADRTLRLLRVLSLLHAVLLGYFLVRVFLVGAARGTPVLPALRPFPDAGSGIHHARKGQPVFAQRGPDQPATNALGIFLALSLGLLLVNAARSLRWMRHMTKAMLLTGYGLPLLMDGLAFFLLLVTRRSLLHAPGGRTRRTLPPGWRRCCSTTWCLRRFAT